MSKSGRTQGRKVARPQKATKSGRGKSARKIPLALGNTKDGAPSARLGGKVAGMIVMLRRVKGASIAELSKATGWQPHSVRAAISATIKKKLGLDVQSEKAGDVRRYRVIDKAGS